MAGHFGIEGTGRWREDWGHGILEGSSGGHNISENLAHTLRRPGGQDYFVGWWGEMSCKSRRQNGQYVGRQNVWSRVLCMIYEH